MALSERLTIILCCPPLLCLVARKTKHTINIISIIIDVIITAYGPNWDVCLFQQDRMEDTEIKATDGFRSGNRSATLNRKSIHTLGLAYILRMRLCI